MDKHMSRYLRKRGKKNKRESASGEPQERSFEAYWEAFNAYKESHGPVLKSLEKMTAEEIKEFTQLARLLPNPHIPLLSQRAKEVTKYKRMETEQEVDKWLEEHRSLLVDFDFLDFEHVVFTFPEVEINHDIYLCGTSLFAEPDIVNLGEAFERFGQLTGCKWVVTYDRRFGFFAIRNLEEQRSDD